MFSDDEKLGIEHWTEDEYEDDDEEFETDGNVKGKCCCCFGEYCYGLKHFLRYTLMYTHEFLNYVGTVQAPEPEVESGNDKKKKKKKKDKKKVRACLLYSICLI